MSQELNRENVLEALKHVIEPDLKKDLVTLNMIDNLTIEGKKVSFSIVLTTPACPLKEMMRKACIEAIHKHVDASAEMEISFTSNVTTTRKQEPTLTGVKNIIAVASGKGGVGKSTVAANLAIALSATGAKVGLMDADIYGPSVPLMFGLTDAEPHMEGDGEGARIIPLEKYGIKVLSIGFFVDDTKALVWRGPMASSALKQLFFETNWGELDYLICDLPPGTGDIHLTLVQSVPVTGAVIVTTPQEVALADARKGIDMFHLEGINVPVLGLIENMSYFTPAELPENKYYIFGKDGGKKLAESMNVPLLGQIPLVQSIRESGDAGKPAALDTNSPVAIAFLEAAKNLAQQVSIRNATKEPTKIVEMQNGSSCGH
ncbi:MAG: Mrp/NBP35 family ATP-binding protein [Bacteroidota bacterium]